MKKIILFIILLLFCLYLTACTNTRIDFKVSYDYMNVFGHKEVDGKYQYFSDAYINSQEQLISLCDEWNNKSFNDKDDEYQSYLSTLLRQYNDDYFQLNDLIIIELETGQGIYTKIKSINFEEDRLIVNIIQKQRNGIWTTEAFRWLIIVEIPKDSTNDVNELVVNFKK